MKVELRQAYEWTCEACGRDQFERAVGIEPEDINRRTDPFDYAEIVEMKENGYRCYFKPSRLCCRSCGANFDSQE